jgi:hypothetical protein
VAQPFLYIFQTVFYDPGNKIGAKREGEGIDLWEEIIF